MKTAPALNSGFSRMVKGETGSDFSGSQPGPETL